MKFFATFSLIFFLSASVFAEDLNKLEPSSRYDVVKSMAELARSKGSRYKKLLKELASELSVIKYERAKEAGETQFSGSLMTQARLAGGEGRFDYRFQLSMLKNFSENSSLKFRLDTVDAGFGTASDRSLATRLIDIESRFKLGRFDYKVNLGPGVVVHTEADDVFASENYTVYIRPKSGVEVSTKVGLLDFSTNYVTRQVAASGLIGVHELTGKLGYSYGQYYLYFNPRYLWQEAGLRDVLTEFGLDYKPDKKLEINALWGVGAFNKGLAGMYLKLIKRLKDYWGTGTNVVVRFDAIGKEYRLTNLDKYEFCYLNNFNRLICDGTADLGVNITQRLSAQTSLELKGDYVTDPQYRFGADYPETYLIWQLGLEHQLSSNRSLKAFYRAYDVPGGVAQFSDSVPTFTSMLGFALSCSL
ncbi:MAG: hypothetical protein KJ811_02165 [Candidatus Margulisbacteria bacterium]|nr:hypothetical protein [Candidatus Margulisiibacteriota bacterium]